MSPLSKEFLRSAVRPPYAHTFHHVFNLLPKSISKMLIVEFSAEIEKCLVTVQTNEDKTFQPGAQQLGVFAARARGPTTNSQCPHQVAHSCL